MYRLLDCVADYRKRQRILLRPQLHSQRLFLLLLLRLFRRALLVNLRLNLRCPQGSPQVSLVVSHRVSHRVCLRRCPACSRQVSRVVNRQVLQVLSRVSNLPLCQVVNLHWYPLLSLQVHLRVNHRRSRQVILRVCLQEVRRVSRVHNRVVNLRVNPVPLHRGNLQANRPVLRRRHLRHNQLWNPLGSLRVIQLAR